MPHLHHHFHSHEGGPSSEKLQRFALAFYLNLGFAFIELVGAYASSSYSVFATALHDLGDAGVLLIAYIFEKVSHRSRSESFHFGYRRFSVFSAFITSIVILSGVLLIAYESALRLGAPAAVEPRGLWMSALAALGIAVNAVSMLRLRRDGGHNEAALRWHFLEDTLSWGLVLVGGVLIHFWHWAWLDPLLALSISLFIAWNMLRNMKQIWGILLQRVPEGVDLVALRQDLEKNSGVVELHDFHVWTLDGERHVLSAHVKTSWKSERWPELKKNLRHLSSHHASFHCTFEIESTVEACVDDCEKDGAK